MTASPEDILTTSPDQHLRAALHLVSPSSLVTVAIAEGHRVRLASDVRAPGLVPAFDNAAMDGHAVRLADLAGGGPLPVLPVENSERDPSGVRVLLTKACGRHVRPQSEEYIPGDLLCSTRLRPVDAGVLAAVGVACILGRRRPHVAVLGTGTVIPGRHRRVGGACPTPTPPQSRLCCAVVKPIGLPPPPVDPDVLLAMAARPSPTTISSWRRRHQCGHP